MLQGTETEIYTAGHDISSTTVRDSALRLYKLER